MNVLKRLTAFLPPNIWHGLMVVCVGLILSSGCIHQQESGMVGDPPVLEGVMHTVSKGETLAGIARAYGVTPQRLARINKIHDPNKLTVGQRIFVPGAESVKTEMMVKAAAPREKGVYHKIERGETLWRIAQAYDVEQRTLQQYNRIHDPRSLEVGQRLFIPGADEVKRVDMSVAERVYHKTPDLEREKRIELAKRIENIVQRHKAEKEGILQPESEPQDESVSAPKEPETKVSVESAGTPPQEAPKEEPAPKIAPKDVAPPEKTKRIGELAFSWPLPDRFTIAKQFGVGTGLMSNGMVLAAPEGTPVIAAADGEVKIVGDVNDEFGDTLGNYIILYHGKWKGKGLRTIYGHNAEVLVKPGDKVQRGQVIAYVGRTGRVARDVPQSQLHFQIREAVQAMNPVKVLPPLQ